MICPATSDDLEELLRIGHEFFKVNPFKLYCQLDNEHLLATFDVLRKDHVLLVMKIDDKVVGCAAAYIQPLFWNFNYKQATEVFWWIDPEHRGDGNGQKLYQALEDACKDSGVDFLSMIALETSMPERVGEMYKKQGFKPIEHTYMKVL